MMQVAIILILAWTLSSVGKDLGTAAYIAVHPSQKLPFCHQPEPVVINLNTSVLSYLMHY